MEGAVLLAVKMEEGPTSPGCSASRSWKRPETILPWDLQKDQLCPHLGLAPKVSENSFKTPTLVVTCDNSHRNQRQCPRNVPGAGDTRGRVLVQPLCTDSRPGASQRGWHLTGLCRRLRNVSRPSGEGSV